MVFSATVEWLQQRDSSLSNKTTTTQIHSFSLSLSFTLFYCVIRISKTKSPSPIAQRQHLAGAYSYSKMKNKYFFNLNKIQFSKKRNGTCRYWLLILVSLKKSKPKRAKMNKGHGLHLMAGLSIFALKLSMGPRARSLLQGVPFCRVELGLNFSTCPSYCYLLFSYEIKGTLFTHSLQLSQKHYI